VKEEKTKETFKRATGEVELFEGTTTSEVEVEPGEDRD
jgi:hypothetical protein